MTWLTLGASLAVILEGLKVAPHSVKPPAKCPDVSLNFGFVTKNTQMGSPRGLAKDGTWWSGKLMVSGRASLVSSHREVTLATVTRGAHDSCRIATLCPCHRGLLLGVFPGHGLSRRSQDVPQPNPESLSPKEEPCPCPFPMWLCGSLRDRYTRCARDNLIRGKIDPNHPSCKSHEVSLVTVSPHVPSATPRKRNLQRGLLIDIYTKDACAGLSV